MKPGNLRSNAELRALLRGEASGRGISPETEREPGPLGRRVPPVLDPETRMNKTEARYAAHLEALLQAGEIVAYRFEALKFRLAKRTFLKTDFLVVKWTRMEVYDVKADSGHWEDDARVKMKVAAALYPWFVFKGVHWGQKERRWIEEEF